MEPSPEQAEALLAAAPPKLVIPGARARIAAANRHAGRRIAVLDDDPTGSQSVHGVHVVMVLEAAEYRSALAEPGAVGFLLTNSRSLGESDARALTRQVSAEVYALETEHGGTTEIISRSDSCLRGHVLAEIEEVRRSCEGVAGRLIDGVLFVPSLFSAGRFTLGDVHWAVVDSVPTPVGHTEYARDATFGYRESRLAGFLTEKSQGRIAADAVLSVPLDAIRTGGPEVVADILSRAHDAQWIIVNAVDDDDLDVVVLGLMLARDRGRTFLYRSGPSFVRALAGIEPRPLVEAGDIVAAPGSAGHGLVVVGSHTKSTTEQLNTLRQRTALAEFELDVAQLLDPARRDHHVQETAGFIRAALPISDVLVYTSRDLTRGRDAADSLAVSRRVSTALVETVARSRSARPSWVLAKGGITSHDVAVHGLGITSAMVLGQVRPGISILRPSDAPAEESTTAFVVFPGNVGSPETLAEVVAVLQASDAPAHFHPTET